MQVYFITTYAFTLLQTLYLAQHDTRRQLGLRKALAANPPVAYAVKVADLPKEMTAVPPLPAGSELGPSTFVRPRHVLRIEPISLAFDVRTGENFPLAPTLELRDPKAQAEVEAKREVEAKSQRTTGGARRT